MFLWSYFFYEFFTILYWLKSFINWFIYHLLKHLNHLIVLELFGVLYFRIIALIDINLFESPSQSVVGVCHLFYLFIRCLDSHDFIFFTFDELAHLNILILLIFQQLFMSFEIYVRQHRIRFHTLTILEWISSIYLLNLINWLICCHVLLGCWDCHGLGVGVIFLDIVHIKRPVIHCSCLWILTLEAAWLITWTLIQFILIKYCWIELSDFVFAVFFVEVAGGAEGCAEVVVGFVGWLRNLLHLIHIYRRIKFYLSCI